MAKHRQQPQRSAQQPSRSGVDTLGVTTLGAVAVVLLVSILSLREVQRMRDDFDGKMDGLEDRIARVADRSASTPVVTAQATPPPRRGPDPNRVYRIKTAGSPTKGPASAAVTIAEFSDFQ